MMQIDPRRLVLTTVVVIAASVSGLVSPIVIAAQDDAKQSDQPPPPDPPRRPAVDRRPNQPTPVRVPPTVEFVEDVVYATISVPQTNAENAEPVARDLTLNAAFPRNSGENNEPLPALIYIHGGGFTGGDKDIGNALCISLAEGGYFACTISYRLLGEAPFPAALHDVKAAVRFIRANAEELGVDPERIGVWGHSAGGHFAAFLGTSGNNPETNGEVGEFADASAAVACVVDFFGTADLAELLIARRGGNAALGSQILGESLPIEQAESKLREYSPIKWIDANDPPFLIIHGDQDRVVPLAQSELLDKALHEAGAASKLVVVEGAGHGVRDPQVMIEAYAFFDRHLGGRAAPVAQRYFDAQRDRAIDQQ